MDKLGAVLGKKPRIVYTDKPVFKVSDPNDPIKYVMRDQGAELEPKQEEKSPLASFLEERQVPRMSEEVNRQLREEAVQARRQKNAAIDQASALRDSGSVVREGEQAALARAQAAVARAANAPATKGFSHNDFFVDAEELPPEIYDRLQSLANSEMSANQKVAEMNQIRSLTQDPDQQEMLNEYEQVLNEEPRQGFQKLRGTLGR